MLSPSKTSHQNYTIRNWTNVQKQLIVVKYIYKQHNVVYNEIKQVKGGVNKPYFVRCVTVGSTIVVSRIKIMNEGGGEIRLLNFILSVLEKLCVVFMAVMVVIIFSQAFARYVLGVSILWSEQIAILSMVWITFLGSAIAWRGDSNIRVDFFLRLLPKKLKAYVEVFNYIICIIFLVILAYYSIQVIELTATQINPISGLPNSLFYLPILISSILMVTYLSLLTIHKIYDEKRRVIK